MKSSEERTCAIALWVDNLTSPLDQNLFLDPSIFREVHHMVSKSLEWINAAI